MFGLHLDKVLCKLGLLAKKELHRLLMPIPLGLVPNDQLDCLLSSSEGTPTD